MNSRCRRASKRLWATWIPGAAIRAPASIWPTAASVPGDIAHSTTNTIGADKIKSPARCSAQLQCAGRDLALSRAIEKECRHAAAHNIKGMHSIQSSNVKRFRILFVGMYASSVYCTSSKICMLINITENHFINVA